jgi:DNA polymerase-3 subunit delta'
VNLFGDDESASSVWDGVVGQDRAVARLRAAADDPVHAYLFIGPAGSTKDVAARAFAARLLAGSDDAHSRTGRLALAGEHPDVREVRRTGAAINKDQIDDIIRIASRAPMEGDRQVLVLDEFHLLSADGAARLLKTLEEPPPSTVFIVLADTVPPEFVTIASRCVRIEFGAIDEGRIERVLLAEGADPDRAAMAARSAAGNLDRARVLVTDDSLVRRRAAFAAVPRRLDGRGATVATLADEITRLADEAAAALAPRHEAEVAALEERIAAMGERGSGRKTLEDQHKREVRRFRTDELRAGLGVIAGAYRDAAVEGRGVRPEVHIHAVERIHRALEALDRNPNEALLLQSLLLDLPSI